MNLVRIYCYQELLPIPFSASALAAETSTSKDARVVGMPCSCVSSSLCRYFLGLVFFPPICVWTLWNYYFLKKKNTCSWFRFLQRRTRTTPCPAQKTVSGDCGASSWRLLVVPAVPSHPSNTN